ncbi:TPA: type II toxin-antitoxin system Phd/YefM family antitoxin [Clostridium perfringens]|uniref:type II toxin-antitoxin system Phd/YefM family antitoxin n=1 Tax=Clostridium perfringens TaxID=1502 RepID=UPI001CACFC92|nr:type II toxin-antitoxin system Phd/YefM family antitoxin [Clostridium perfringens]HBI6893322.1 type II toxin-antitoxin system Phd/YefM family antitoxin [Clostridium perfringens]HBI6902177.1 type II toxin-antitoxin system Phd/YefM family antitoxin [Clostridium perfringens]HBI6905329.1 type II toxin-antitoxin system Phd/YefM family antitoxin [Clostridium perfringens]HBI6908339.1 type II toxin-antitoxin system Phd/YefM family antitoxin [Clostridium perfringens]
MNISMEREAIVSATELVKNFASIRKKAKDGLNMIVFKNNKPDLAIVDIDEYANLLKMAELLEDLTITQMAEERIKEDNGVRYTSEDAIRRRKERKKQVLEI